MPFGVLGGFQVAVQCQVSGGAGAVLGRAGVALGDDYLNNPTTDPSVVSQWVTLVTLSVEAPLTQLKVAVSAASPLWPAPGQLYTQTIAISLPTNTTYADLQLSDVWPGNLAWAGAATIAITPSAAAYKLTAEPAATGVPVRDNLVGLLIPGPVDGAKGPYTVTVQFQVPLVDAAGAPVLLPSTSSPATALHSVTLRGGNETSSATFAQTLLPSSTAANKTCAQVKTGAGCAGWVPGDKLQYRVEFPGASGFFSLGGLALTDVLSDGQLLDQTFPPVLSVDGAAPGLTFTRDVDLKVDAAANTLYFDITALLGGRPVTPTAASPLNLAIVYRVDTLALWLDPSTKKNKCVVERDVIGSQATFSGSFFDASSGSLLGPLVVAPAVTSFAAAPGQMTAGPSVYAVNGNACSPQPCAASSYPANSLLTLRVLFTLPFGSTDTLTQSLFLPVPLIVAPSAVPFDSGSGTAKAPSASRAKFGPEDTYFAATGLAAAVTPSPSGRLDVTLQPWCSPDSRPLTVDVLISVLVNDPPGAPNGTPLSIVGYTADGVVVVSPVPVVLGVPSLICRLGVVGVDNSLVTLAPPLPAGGFSPSAAISSPGFLSLALGLDAGDLVTFAMTVVNQGSQDAFDVQLVYLPALPAGFTIPAAGIGLQVLNAAGAPIPYTTAGSTIALTNADSLTGSIRGGSGAIVTFQLQVDSTVLAGSTLANLSVSAPTYASFWGSSLNRGPAAASLSGLTVAIPLLSVTELSSSDPLTTAGRYNTALTDLAIGETVTYRVRVSLTEGITSSLVLGTTLAAGLTYVSGTITPGTKVTFPSGTPSAVIAGQSVSWTFASVLNTPEVPDVSGFDATDYLDISILAKVATSNANFATPPKLFTNTFTMQATNVALTTVTAPNLELVEPCLQIATTGGSATGDAGDTFAVSFTISHCASSAGPAQLLDFRSTNVLLPPDTFLGATTVTATGGATIVTGNTPGDTAVRVTLAALPLGSTLVVSYTIRMAQGVTPGAISSTHVLTFESTTPTGTGFAYGPLNSNLAFTVSGPTWVSWAVVSTSLTQTGTAKVVATNEDLLIGEYAVYRAVIRMHEGSTTAAGVTVQFNLGITNFPMHITNAVVVSYGTNIGSTTLAAGTDISATATSIGSTASSLESITFNLGQISNTWDNTVDTKDLITIDVTARIEDNALATGTTNTATLGRIACAGVNTNYASTFPAVDFIAPVLTTTVTALPAATTVDAGDDITFTLSVACGNAAAQGAGFDVSVAITMPATFFGAPLTLSSGSFTVGTGGTLATSLTANTVTFTSTFMNAGSTMTMTFRAIPLQAINPSQTTGNFFSTVTWKSAPTTPATVARSYTANSANLVYTALAPTMTCSVSATSLPETGATQLVAANQDIAIGETFTVSLVILLKEFTFKASGLTVVLNVPSTYKAKVIDARVNSYGSQISGQTQATATNIPGTDLNADTVLDTVTISLGPMVDTFDNVVDTKDNINVDVTFKVFHVAAYVYATPLSIGASLSWNQPTSTLTASCTPAQAIDVVQPTLNTTKAGNRTTADAGDAVLFTVTISHLGAPCAAGASCAPAYDLVVTDALTGDFALSLGTITAVNSGGQSTDSTASAGNSVNVRTSVLMPGQTLTITYTAVLTTAVGLASTISNTANSAWNSAPSASATEFRSYTGSSTYIITVLPPVLLSTVIITTTNADTGVAFHNTANTDLSIGETFTASFVIQLPEGSTNLTARATVPNTNMEAVLTSAAITTVGGNLGTVAGAAVFSDAGGISTAVDRAVWTFGIIVNNPDGVTDANDQLVLTVTGTVTAHSSNVNAVTDSLVTFVDYVRGTTSGSAAVDLVVPKYTVAKTKSTCPVRDAGCVITFTLTTTFPTGNTGHTGPAYQVAIMDSVNAAGFLVSQASVAWSTVPAGFLTSLPPVNTGSGNNVVLTFPKITTQTASPITSLVVTFTATVIDAARLGVTYSNTYNITGTTDFAPTLPYSRVLSLTSASVSETLVQPTCAWALVSSTESLTTAALLDADQDLTVGESMTQRLTVTLPEGTGSLKVTMTMGTTASIKYVITEATISARSPLVVPTYLNGTTPVDLAAFITNTGALATGDSVVADFGDVLNPGNNVVLPDVIQIDVVFIVSNTIGSPSVLSGAAGQSLTASCVGNSNAVVSTAVVTVDNVYPSTAIATAANPNTGVDAGDTVTFTTTITNAATYGPSYSIEVNWTPPAGMTNVNGQVSTSGAGCGSPVINKGNGGEGVVQVTIGSMSTAATCQVIFKALLADSVVAGSTINSTVSGTYRSATLLASAVVYTLAPSIAGVTVKHPTIASSVTGTSEALTLADLYSATANDITPGESATVRYTVTLGEGRTNSLVVVLAPTTTVQKWKVVSGTVVSIGTSLTPTTVLAGCTGGALVNNVGVTADSCTLTFGNTDNLPATNAAVAADDQIVVDVVYQLLNTFAVAPATATNSVRGSITGYTSTAVDNFDVTRPSSSLTLTASPSTGVDAGAVITYTATVTNLNSGVCTTGSTCFGPGYLMALASSAATTGLSWNAGSVTVGTCTGLTSSIGSTVNVTIPTLARGTSCQFTFAGTLLDPAVLGSSPSVSLSGTYASSTAPERATYTYTLVSATATLLLPSVGTVPTFTTDDAITGVGAYTAGYPDLTVGESVVWTFKVALPEGTVAGLAVVFNCVGTSINLKLAPTSSSVSAVDTQILQTNYVVGVTPGAYTNVVDNTDGSNDRVTFAFASNVVNQYNNAGTDYITFSITARLEDKPTNTRGLSVPLTYTVTPGAFTVSTFGVDVVQFLPSITAAANITSGDAGDRVTYTVTFKGVAPSDGPVYNVALSDPGTVYTSLVSGSVTTTCGTVTTGNGNSDTAVLVAIPSMLALDSCKVTYQATLDVILQNATSAVASAASYSARTANNTFGRVLAGSATASLDVVMFISMTHLYVSSTLTETTLAQYVATDADLAVGEVVTTEVTITLAEGTQNFNLTLNGPLSTSAAKFKLLDATCTQIGSQLSGLTFGVSSVFTAVDTANPATDGIPDKITVYSAGMLNAPDNIVDDKDRLVFRVRGYFIDHASNTGGQVATMDAVLAYLSGSATRTVNVELVTPVFTVTKAISSAPNPADAGDAAVFTVTVSHTAATSRAPLYDVKITELLNANFALQPGAATVKAQISGVDVGTISPGLGASDTTVVVSVPVFPLGADLVVTVTTRLSNVVGYLTPTVSSAATFTAGSSPAGSDLRPYSVTTAAPAVNVTNVPVLVGAGVLITATSDPNTGTAFRTAGVTDLVIGETVTFELTYQLREGTSNVVFQLDVPTASGELVMTSATVVSIGASITGSALLAGATGTLLDTNADSLSNRGVFALGTVVNNGDNLANTGDQITVRAVARVTNNTSKNIVGTTSYLISGSLNYTLATLTPAAVSAELVGPLLTVTAVNSLSVAGGDAGDLVTFNVTVAHSGTSTGPAYDVVITGALGANFFMQAGSVTTGVALSPTVLSGNASSDTSVAVSVPSVLSGAVVVSFTAALANSVGWTANPASISASISYRSISGALGAGYTAGPSTSSVPIVHVPITPVVVISSSTDPATTAPGLYTAAEDVGIYETATFRVTATLREGTAGPVTLTVKLPKNSAQGRLTVVASRVVSIGAQITGSALAVGSAGTVSDTNADSISDQVVFSFGTTLINAGNNVVDAGDTLVVEVDGLVSSISSNVAAIGTVQTTSADFAWGGSGGPVTGTRTFEIVDGNTAPVIAAQNFSVAENVVTGTAVGAVAATDADALPPNNVITFSITAGNTGTAFAINSTTGALTTAAAINFENLASYALTVRATDGGGKFSSATVTINIIDVNEAPSVNSGQIFTVAENLANGTAVGTVTRTDPDTSSPFNDKTFAIEAGNTGGAFDIDKSTGLLKVAGVLDFETNPRYTLTVRVTDGPGLTSTNTVAVNLTDVNEAPVMLAQAFTIAENAAAASLVGTVVSTDPDLSSPFNTKAYSITAGNGLGAFTINSATGAITVASASPLNFEVNPSFALTVQVKDNNNAGLTASNTVTITLTDVNEVPVLLAQAFTLAENSAVSALVGTVVSTDPDLSSPFNSKTYSITAGNGLGAFTINLATGAITVASASPLNFEVNPSFALTVQVRDNNNAGLTASNTVTITLTDVNEAPTMVAQNFTALETLAPGTVVGTVVRSDPDQSAPFNGRTFSIVSGNLGSSFSMDPSTGALFTAAALDFETQPIFALVVQVVDGGSPPLVASAAVTVLVTDVNEAPTIAAQVFSVNENSAAGATVGTVIRSDPDQSSPFNDRTFSLTAGNRGSAFAIDASTGVLTVLTPSVLDYEAGSSFTLTVRVVDGPGLSGTGTVTISLVDVNEAPAIALQAFTIPENLAASSAVGTVLATDPDQSAPFRSLTFSIEAGNTGSAFAINATTGAITVKTSAALNYEVNATFTLTVRVADGGAPPLNATATVTVTLTDVNEAPSITALTLFSIPENPAPGFIVGTVVSSDPDTSAPFNARTFSILSGNAGSPFAIDPLTGSVTVQTPSMLDFESTPFFTLMVLVSDSGTPALTANGTVNITLTDVNEAPFVAALSFTVAENTAASSAVGTLVSADPDLSAPFNTRTFAILSGNTGLAFSIHPTTGQLTVQTPSMLNFESTPSFTLTVKVADGGTPPLSATSTVTITLLDVNEPPTLTASSFSVPENALVPSVGIVLRVDPDMTAPFNSSSFSIVGGNLGSVFALNPTTGLLSLTSPLNYEDVSSYSLVVRVVDGGGLAATGTIQVLVIDVNEPPVPTPAIFTVNETAPVGAIVGFLAAVDPESQPLAYSLSPADPTGRFRVSDSGAVVVASALDFETSSAAELVFKVVDRGNLSANSSLSITIVNINEPPAWGDGIPLVLQIKEFSVPGTVVVKVTVFDPDTLGPAPYNTTTLALNPGSVYDGAFALINRDLVVVSPTLLTQRNSSSITLSARDAGGLRAPDLALFIEVLAGPGLVTTAPAAVVAEGANRTVVMTLKPSFPPAASALDIVCASDSPRLALTTSGFSVLAAVPGDGNTTGTLTYNVTCLDRQGLIRPLVTTLQVADREAFFGASGAVDLFEGFSGEAFRMAFSSAPIGPVTVTVAPLPSAQTSVTSAVLDSVAPVVLDVPLSSGLAGQEFSPVARVTASLDPSFPVGTLARSMPRVVVQPADTGVVFSFDLSPSSGVTVFEGQPFVEAVITVTRPLAGRAPVGLYAVRLASASPSRLKVRISSSSPSSGYCSMTGGMCRVTMQLEAVDDQIAYGSLPTSVTVDLVRTVSTVTAPSSGQPSVATALLPVLVVDDDTLGAVFNASCPAIEGGPTTVGSVRLSADPRGTLLVSVRASGIVLVPSAQVFTFTSADWAQPRTFAFQGLVDGVVDGLQMATLFAVVASTGEALGNASVPVLDADTPAGALQWWPPVLTVPEGTSGVFHVGSTRAVSADAVVPSGSTVKALASATSGGCDGMTRVTVTVADDDYATGDLPFAVSVGSTTLPCIAQDNDTSGVRFAETEAGCVTSEAPTSSAWQAIALTSKPLSPVIITLTSNDTGEGVVEAAFSSLIFTPSNWSVPQNFTVHGVRNDLDAEADAPFSVVASTSSPYNLTRSRGLACLNKNTLHPVAVRVEPDLLDIGTDTMFVITLARSPGVNVTVVSAMIAGLPATLVNATEVDPLTFRLAWDAAAADETAFAALQQQALPKRVLPATWSEGPDKVVMTLSNGVVIVSPELYIARRCGVPGQRWSRARSRCEVCSDPGMVCPGGNRTWAAKGHTVSDGEGADLAVLPCAKPERCPRASIAVRGGCQEPWSGPTCSTCAPGYFPVGTSCESCPRSSLLAGSLLVILFLALVALYCTVAIRLKPVESTAAAFFAAITALVYVSGSLLDTASFPPEVHRFYLRFVGVPSFHPDLELACGSGPTLQGFRLQFAFTMGAFLCAVTLVAAVVGFFSRSRKDTASAVGTLVALQSATLAPRSFSAMHCIRITGTARAHRLSVDSAEVCFAPAHSAMFAAALVTAAALLLGCAMMVRRKPSPARGALALLRPVFVLTMTALGAVGGFTSAGALRGALACAIVGAGGAVAAALAPWPRIRVAIVTAAGYSIATVSLNFGPSVVWARITIALGLATLGIALWAAFTTARALSLEADRDQARKALEGCEVSDSVALTTPAEPPTMTPPEVPSPPSAAAAAAAAASPEQKIPAEQTVVALDDVDMAMQVAPEPDDIHGSFAGKMLRSGPSRASFFQRLQGLNVPQVYAVAANPEGNPPATALSELLNELGNGTPTAAAALPPRPPRSALPSPSLARTPIAATLARAPATLGVLGSSSREMAALAEDLLFSPSPAARRRILPQPRAAGPTRSVAEMGELGRALASSGRSLAALPPAPRSMGNDSTREFAALAADLATSGHELAIVAEGGNIGPAMARKPKRRLLGVTPAGAHRVQARKELAINRGGDDNDDDVDEGPVQPVDFVSLADELAGSGKDLAAMMQRSWSSGRHQSSQGSAEEKARELSSPFSVDYSVPSLSPSTQTAVRKSLFRIKARSGLARQPPPAQDPEEPASDLKDEMKTRLALIKARTSRTTKDKDKDKDKEEMLRPIGSLSAEIDSAVDQIMDQARSDDDDELGRGRGFVSDKPNLRALKSKSGRV